MIGTILLLLLAQAQVTIRDESVHVCRSQYIDFVGAGVTATCPAGVGTVTIGAGGGGAPSTAQYWTATADAGLSAERDLGLLTTGLVLNTVTAAVGVPSTYAGTTPCSAQFIRSISASGVATCEAIADADVPNTITVDLAAAATALAANPADCVDATHFSVGVLASGVAVCEAIADADVPNTITVDLATAASALAANGANCAANNFALGVSAAGVAECAQPAFADLSGAATDAQVPNTITVDLATLATTATTATTANAGDSATAFFTSGMLENTRGGTGVAPTVDDQLILSDATWRTLPDCGEAGTLNYSTTTNEFSCLTDASSSGAPTTATYITQTADAGLSAEQALSALATGYMKVTTTTGVITSQAVPIPIADGGTGNTTGSGWTDDGTIVRLTTSTDKVGIGTTSFGSSTLNVNGNIGMAGTSGGSYLYFPDTGTHTGTLQIQAGFGSAGAGGGLTLYGHSHTTKPGWVTVGISQLAGSGTTEGRFTVNDQGVGGAGTDLFTVLRTGNVGVGMVPDYKLDVSASTGGILRATNGTNDIFKVISNKDVAVNTDQLVVKGSTTGNTGFGTITPGAKVSINGGLHVGGDSDPGNDNALIDGTLTVTGATTLTTTLGVASGGTASSTGAPLAKFWVVAGVAGDITASYNVTSVTDGGTGQMTVTIATDFSSAEWACLATVQGTSFRNVQYYTIAAGSVTLLTYTDLGGGIDPINRWSVAGFGNQ